MTGAGGGLHLCRSGEPDSQRLRPAGDLERHRAPPATRPDHGQLEIVGTSQRPAVGGGEQVAGANAAGRGETGGVDVAHEQAGDGREPDGSSPLERDRGAIDHEPQLGREGAARFAILERV